MNVMHRCAIALALVFVFGGGSLFAAANQKDEQFEKDILLAIAESLKEQAPSSADSTSSTSSALVVAPQQSQQSGASAALEKLAKDSNPAVQVQAQMFVALMQEIRGNATQLSNQLTEFREEAYANHTTTQETLVQIRDTATDQAGTLAGQAEVLQDQAGTLAQQAKTLEEQLEQLLTQGNQVGRIDERVDVILASVQALEKASRQLRLKAAFATVGMKVLAPLVVGLIISPLPILVTTPIAFISGLYFSRQDIMELAEEMPVLNAAIRTGSFFWAMASSWLPSRSSSSAQENVVPVEPVSTEQVVVPPALPEVTESLDAPVPPSVLPDVTDTQNLLGVHE
ncbi:hypothetical protein K2W90_03740 [Candidatus Babeliales bacterium]|nr:hypothetical protein [Candidatus Babeliales bacterium]